MPAITLGLAEIEERLHVLRRRLNIATLLHAAFLSLSTLFFVTAALVAVGLRGDVSSFRAVTWSGVVLVAGAAAGCAILTHRRWLDEPATAEFVDQRGQLTDRLTTLIDLRRRPRTSRLAPVLIAQTLALGERWRPQRIIPRRVPRSLFLVLLSLIALSASPLLAPAPPPALPLSPPTHAEKSLSGTQDDAAVASQAGNDSAGGDAIQGGMLHRMSDASAPQALGESSAQQSPLPVVLAPDTASAMLPDRLRDALRSALHADQMDRGHELGKNAAGQPNERAPNATDDRAGAPSDGAVGRRLGEAGKSPSEHEAGPRKSQHPDDASAREQTRQAKNEMGDQSQRGSAPYSGTGSRPENLLGTRAVVDESGQAGAPTFKLMITSFLHAVEEQDTQRRQTDKRGASGAAVNAGEPILALNEQQRRDDALRKAEIPPEYEDIVRRVYSSRSLDVQDSPLMGEGSFGPVARDPTGSGSPEGRGSQPAEQ